MPCVENKDKYNERTAEVTGLNSRQAKVTMLDGPSKGEKRKVAYNQIKLKSKGPPAKKLFAQLGVASSAAAAPQGAAAGVAATLPRNADPSAPAAACMEMFGKLDDGDARRGGPPRAAGPRHMRHDGVQWAKRYTMV